MNVYDDMDNLHMILSEIKCVRELASFHHLSICDFPLSQRYPRYGSEFMYGCTHSPVKFVCIVRLHPDHDTTWFVCPTPYQIVTAMQFCHLPPKTGWRRRDLMFFMLFRSFNISRCLYSNHLGMHMLIDNVFNAFCGVRIRT